MVELNQTSPTNLTLAQNRPDHLLMLDMIDAGARVLDVGCGDGHFLELLKKRSNVDARGIEISQKRVNQCVARGLSVIQGDADQDLQHYPDKAFDYAILSLTIQATHRPQLVLEQLLRIGSHVIVSFPNFGYWRTRGQLLFKGRMPVTQDLPVSWYETPNIHLCTLLDFYDLCEAMRVTVENVYALRASGKPLSSALPHHLQNLLGQQAIFVLKS